ncbi:MAG: hypothetical protein JEZ05_10745 [Tenericutes bacterium]|nr:hypothetical protein [Mycoplasmatota bacterium]
MKENKSQVAKDYIKKEVNSFWSIVKSFFKGLLLSIGIGILLGILSSSFLVGLFFFLLTILVVTIRILFKLYQITKTHRKEQREVSKKLMGDEVGDAVMDIIETSTDGKKDWSKLDAEEVGRKIVDGVKNSQEIKDAVKQKIINNGD